MISLEAGSGSIQLLRWTKELPSSSTQDPLGLNLRLGARFSAELLHCITSITPRARYFSFYPWAFQDYFENERNTPGDRGLMPGVVARERAMVLGAILHHEGAACTGGALVGSDRTRTAVARNERTYNVDRFKHLDRNEGGAFAQAYKASLVNLQLFESPGQHVSDDVNPDTGELESKAQSVEVKKLSGTGMALASAYLASISDTRYVREGWARKSEIDSDVLREFGARAGLCEILESPALDRAPLRDVFFSTTDPDRQSAHQRRRMSLLLLLELIRQTQLAGRTLNRWQFANLTYFGCLLPDEDDPRPAPIELPAALTDIQHRWRIFYFHSNLGLGLQTFLVGLVRALRDKPGGLDREALVSQLAPPAMDAALSDAVETPLPRSFLDLTPRETLALFGVSVQQALNGEAGALAKISSADVVSERGLGDLLIDEGCAEEASGVGLAAILIYCTLLRYRCLVEKPYDNWCKAHVSDAYSDVSVPGVLDDLRVGDDRDGWWDRTNRQVLDRLIWRFVVLQHQTMSYERERSTAPLFHVDGAKVIGTSMEFSDPSVPNSRFNSAMRILLDLGLATEGEDGIELTGEGARFLDQELKRSINP